MTSTLATDSMGAGDVAAVLRELVADNVARTHVMLALSQYAERMRADEKQHLLPACFPVLVQGALDACGATVAPQARDRWQSLAVPAEGAATMTPMEVSIKDAAAALGISTRQVARMIRHGEDGSPAEIGSRKRGRRRLIPVAELERLAAQPTKEI